MTYIGLDVGNKRVGVAILRENIAFAERVVMRVDIVSWLKKYFKEHTEVENIVVGLPYDLYGTDNRQLERTQKFIEKLINIFPEKNIIGHDERFSSVEASEGFGDHRDDIAAGCILQSYVDSINK